MEGSMEGFSSYDLFNQPQPDVGASTDEEALIEARRTRLIDRIRRGGRDLDTLEERVAFILSRFPQTRNSDVTLQLQYWQIFECHLLGYGGMPTTETYYAVRRLNDLARARRVVQNDLGLFVATDERVATKRRQRAEDFRVAHVPEDVSVPAIFVYADESGKNADHLVVGSVWMVAPGEYQRFISDAAAWKEAHGVDYELHSSSLGKPRMEGYRAFIEQFVFNRGSLGFKAVSMPNVGFKSEAEAFTDLFYILLRQGILHEHESGRAPLPRHVYFIKDAEAAGTDAQLITRVQSQIQRDAKSVFDGLLYCTMDDPVPSDTEVLIQIADLFTWAVNRHLNPPKGQPANWKDEFAEWFLDGVGFEMDTTTTIGDRAVRLSLKSPLLSPSTVPVVERPSGPIDE